MERETHATCINHSFKLHMLKSKAEMSFSVIGNDDRI